MAPTGIFPFLFSRLQSRQATTDSPRPFRFPGERPGRRLVRKISQARSSRPYFFPAKMRRRIEMGAVVFQHPEAAREVAVFFDRAIRSCLKYFWVAGQATSLSLMA